MKPKKFLKFIAMMVILVFLFSYFLCFSGYYEYNLQKKRDLTDEQIKQFDEDVKNGKEISLEGYLTETTIDYSNTLTRRTSEVNLRLNDYLKRFLMGSFEMFGKFIK